MSCCGLSFLVVGQVVRRGEDERKTQPDVASLVLRLPAIRGACCRGRGRTATGREGGGARGLGGPGPGQRSSRTGSERAAAGRAGPAGEVKGRGLPGCLWGGEPTGSCASPRLEAAGRRSRGRSARGGRPLGSRAWASGFKTFRHTTGTRATHSEEASLSVQDSCSWDQQSFFFFPLFAELQGLD